MHKEASALPQFLFYQTQIYKYRFLQSKSVPCKDFSILSFCYLQTTMLNIVSMSLTFITWSFIVYISHITKHSRTEHTLLEFECCITYNFFRYLLISCVNKGLFFLISAFHFINHWWARFKNCFFFTPTRLVYTYYIYHWSLVSFHREHVPLRKKRANTSLFWLSTLHVCYTVVIKSRVELDCCEKYRTRPRYWRDTWITLLMTVTLLGASFSLIMACRGSRCALLW